MRGSSLLPERFRKVSSADSAEAGWMNRHVTKTLQSVSRRACKHPIHTIVFIALLASTTYVGLLDGTLFDSVKHSSYSPGHVDIDTLLEGGRNLRLGEQTGWKWQVDDTLQLGDNNVRATRVFLL